MSEFSELLKEAFAGAEPFDAHPGREDLDAAVARFERRDRTVRGLAWTAVALLTVPVVWAVHGLAVAAPDAAPKGLVVKAVVLICGMSAIGFMKAFLYDMRNHLDQMKELKRVQMLLLEAAARR